MDVSINSNRVFHYKPSILGYPYFWKHPYKHFERLFSNCWGFLPVWRDAPGVGHIRDILGQPWTVFDQSNQTQATFFDRLQGLPHTVDDSTSDVWNPVDNLINNLSTGAGFQPSTVVWEKCVGKVRNTLFPLAFFELRLHYAYEAFTYCAVRGVYPGVSKNIEYTNKYNKYMFFDHAPAWLQ